MTPVKVLEKNEMSVALQLDPALTPAPPIEVETLETALAAVAAVNPDARLANDLCVRVCSAEESQALNAAFRDKDHPTNVLSFSADPDLPVEAAPLGDLAICWPVVEKEASDQGKQLLDHFTHLFVHGLLHLLDHDHETDAEAKVMESLEVKILAQLGLPNPYKAGH
jgi:probable rRNA maturation factor